MKKNLTTTEVFCVAGSGSCKCTTFGKNRKDVEYRQVNRNNPLCNKNFVFKTKSECINKCCEELGMEEWSYGDLTGTC